MPGKGEKKKQMMGITHYFFDSRMDMASLYGKDLDYLGNARVKGMERKGNERRNRKRGRTKERKKEREREGKKERKE